MGQAIIKDLIIILSRNWRSLHLPPRSMWSRLVGFSIAVAPVFPIRGVISTGPTPIDTMYSDLHLPTQMNLYVLPKGCCPAKKF
jgi:hypothetical protein